MGSFTWSDTQSFSMTFPTGGGSITKDTLTVPPGMAPHLSSTLVFAAAVVDEAGNACSSTTQLLSFIDSTGSSNSGITGNAQTMFNADAELLAGGLYQVFRSNWFTLDPLLSFGLNGGGKIRFSLGASFVSPTASVTLTGVIAAGVFDLVGTSIAGTLKKSPANPNSGALDTVSHPVGRTNLDFIVIGSDTAALPPSTSPSATLPDLSGGATTNWSNVARITNGPLWAALGVLDVVDLPTSAYNFTNVSSSGLDTPLLFGGPVGGINIFALTSTTLASRGRSFGQVIG